MSDEARKEQIDAFKYSDKVVAATHIGGIDRELSLYEIAQMTRAGPAKSLGLCAPLWRSHARNGRGCCGLQHQPRAPITPDEIEKAFTKPHLSSRPVCRS